MYFVPDGTEKCGFYECKDCGYRFLSVETEPMVVCPTCEGDVDYEIGPDDVMGAAEKNAVLLEIVEGEDVEKMDILLSLAITGGDYSWI